MSLYRYLSAVVGVDAQRALRLQLSTRQRVTAFGLAIHLPVIVWAGTGFVVASQIFGGSTGFSAAVSLGCGSIIYLVERLVLESPPSRWLSIFRLVLGVIVAVLGASTVDLVIFDREVAQQLKADGEVRIKSDFDEKIEAAKAQLNERKRDWLQAQEAAQCEANGTCGSRRASVGPVYRELARQAATLRADYMTVESALVDLKRAKVSALERWAESNAATENAGLLARIKALHAYIQSDTVAYVAWALFFGLMVLLEMMVVFAKWAFGKTADDEMDAIREEIKLHHARAYRDAITSPAYEIEQLIEAPVSGR